MYYLYTVTKGASGTHYQRHEEISLFGCNVGLLPRMLRALPLNQRSEKWHLGVKASLAGQAQAAIISLKPKNKDATAVLSLYGLSDVWGVSGDGWTRIMLRLQGLVVDGSPHVNDPTDFVLSLAPPDDSILTFLYLQGSIESGELKGKWTPAGPSPTNSVLLWPADFQYFLSCLRDADPDLLHFDKMAQ